MLFKDIEKGLFRYKGIVYTKIEDTQAVLITTGEVLIFNPEQEIELY